PRGLSGPAPRGEEDGVGRRAARHDPRCEEAAPGGGPLGRRGRAEARRGDHRLDDAGGTPKHPHPERQPPQAHRRGQRNVGVRSESAREAVHADEEALEEDWLGRDAARDAGVAGPAPLTPEGEETRWPSRSVSPAMAARRNPSTASSSRTPSRHATAASSIKSAFTTPAALPA